MSTTTWVAHLTWATTPDIDTEALANHLIEGLGGDAAGYGPRSVDVRITLDGADWPAAEAATRRRAAAAGPLPAGCELVAVEIQRADHFDEQLGRPLLPHLVGITEAAEILGVSRQRAHALAQGSDFPPPITHLASGPVYLESAVRAFAARPRRSGRPARSA